jgi:phage terminase large subunit GpA-like protein
MQDAIAIADTVVLMTSSQVGKALTLDTPLPTPEGWTNIKDVAVGDTVFDEKGAPCKVVATSDVFLNHDCFEVMFCDGSKITADSAHRWTVNQTKWAKKLGSVILTTQEIYELKKKSGVRFSIPTCAPLICPKSQLAIDPYLFGVYLGDGSRASGRISCSAGDVAHYKQEFSKLGYETIARQHKTCHGLSVNLVSQDVEKCIRGHVLTEVGLTGGKWPGYCAECKRQSAMWVKHKKKSPDPIVNKQKTLRTALSEIKLLNKPKIIPLQYLRSNYVQRLSLLQGLMDTDGTVDKDGRLSFCNTEYGLIQGVSELLSSLGIKHSIKEKQPYTTYKGVRVKGALAWGITFTTYREFCEVFRLPRKLARMASFLGSRACEPKRRMITNVNPIQSVPTKCISVDSPSHLFLAGESMIPTHNTTLIENVIGYHIHLDPCPILFLNPTLEMSETFSKDRLSPMLRDCECLHGLVAASRSRDKNSTILHKVFKGGHLTMAGANSPASLASRPVRKVLFDEVDRFALSAGQEGDPVKLAMKRATRFWNRGFTLCSTPTIKDNSRIEKAWLISDQRRYFVPCPHCDHFQVLVWKQIKWSDRDPATAYYECESCTQSILSQHKPVMVRRGQWRATNPAGKYPGFHIWEGYFPTTPWSRLVEEFLEAKDDPEQLKVFVNTVLGELWREDDGDQVEWQQLMERAEPYATLSVPAKALLLTAGVDVQADRLECSVWGWGEKSEAWLIYHTVLWGDPAEESVWAELDLFLDSTLDHESGAALRITATAIDTGYLPQMVYNFVRLRPGRGLYAIKGMSTPGRPLWGKPTPQEVTWKGKTLKKGIRLWPVGTDTAKGLFTARLKLLKPGPGYLHFPIGLEEEYYLQLTAERRVPKITKGFTTYVWVKTRKRNEALDCAVYALAAAYAAGIERIDWAKLRARLEPKPLPPESETVEALPILGVTSAAKTKKRERRRNWTMG